MCVSRWRNLLCWSLGSEVRFENSRAGAAGERRALRSRQPGRLAGKGVYVGDTGLYRTGLLYGFADRGVVVAIGLYWKRKRASLMNIPAL